MILISFVGCLPSLSHFPTPPVVFSITTYQINQLFVYLCSASGLPKLDSHLNGEYNTFWIAKEEEESMRQHKGKEIPNRRRVWAKTSGCKLVSQARTMTQKF